jgi:hypothetical protein
MFAKCNLAFLLLLNKIVRPNKNNGGDDDDDDDDNQLMRFTYSVTKQKPQESQPLKLTQDILLFSSMTKPFF